ncbi:MAG TPA: hypothetical protein VK908_02765 [Jiangellales bacterium]|nr:hypothetical protein [Jiangellales bacterium]
MRLVERVRGDQLVDDGERLDGTVAGQQRIDQIFLARGPGRLESANLGRGPGLVCYVLEGSSAPQLQCPGEHLSRCAMLLMRDQLPAASVLGRETGRVDSILSVGTEDVPPRLGPRRCRREGLGAAESHRSEE